MTSQEILRMFSHPLKLSGDFLDDVARYWINFEEQTKAEELIGSLKSPSSFRNNWEKLTNKRNYINSFFKSTANFKKREPDAQGENELTAISHELKEISQKAGTLFALPESESEVENIILSDDSPRKKYLVQRYFYLRKRQTMYEKNRGEIPKKIEKNKVQSSGVMVAIFDIGKKIADVLDDVWNLMRAVLPVKIVNAVSPYIFAGFSFLVHGVEGYTAAKKFVHVYKKENAAHRKTKLAVNLVTAVLAGIGVGLGASLLVGAAGVSVLGFELMPVPIIGLLTGIYSLAFLKQAYFCYKAKQKLAQSKKDTLHLLEKNRNILTNLQTDFLKIQQKKSNLEEQLDVLSHKKTWSVDDKKNYDGIVLNLKLLQVDEFHYQNNCATLYGEMESNKQRYHECKDAYTKNKRKLVFNGIEAFQSALIFAGTILMFAGVLGLSTMSFGILPITLVLSGVAIGVGLKAFEHVDEKKNHCYSNTIGHFFAKGWNQFFSKKSVHSPVNKKNHYDMPVIKNEPVDKESQEKVEQSTRKVSCVKDPLSPPSVIHFSHFSAKQNDSMISENHEAPYRSLRANKP